MIPGIDVSHYQGEIDWAKVKAAGIRFAYLKATQGATFIDPMLKANYAGAKAQGIPIGLYHVFNAYLGDAQFTHWRNVLAAYPPQVPSWLDIEPGALTEDTAPQALSFLEACFQPSDCIYCSPSTAQAVLNDPAFQNYKLAIAHYTEAPSPNIVLWSDWMFWQHSCVGTVDGISTPVDLDWFNGSEDEFLGILRIT